LFLLESPFSIENCHIEVPLTSSKERVLFPLNHENAYNNNYDFTNARPR
jgi:hypothetical protein